MSIRKNMTSNLLLTSSAVIFPLITFPYVTRTLSSNSIGKYFFIDAITQYLIIFSAVGIPYYGIREIAKVKDQKQKRSKLVAELLIIQVTLAVLFSILFIALHFFVPALKTDFEMIKIGCLGIISTSFMMEWFYQGIENFTYITGRSLVIKTISVAAILLLVKHTDDYLIYYLIITLVILANSALNFFNYLKKYHVAFNEKISINQHLRPLLILFSINVSVSIYAIMDTIILGMLTNPETVSFYNVPLKLVKIFWTIVNGAGIVLIPRIAGYFISNDLKGIQNIMRKSFSIVFLFTIPFCFFCITFSNEILTIVSGNKYQHAANVLKLLAVVPLIIAVCNICGTQFLMPIGQEKSILYATLIGLVISLCLNFLLIPHLGDMGAAITCVAAEGTVCIYMLIAAIKRIKFMIDYSLILQILLSLSVTTFSRYLLSAYFNGFILITIVFCVYCVAFTILQLFYFKNSFITSLYKSNRLIVNQPA